MPSTDRIYANAQADFADWCGQRRIRGTPSMDVVATYLCECLTERGPSAAAVRASAIARGYRDAGKMFDVKALAIQNVLTEARRIKRKQKFISQYHR
jgi:hypothetical protein